MPKNACVDSTCPVCGAERVKNCKCMVCESQCGNNHVWHYCPEHNKKILGPADHTKHGCCCDESAVKIREQKIQERVRRGVQLLETLEYLRSRADVIAMLLEKGSCTEDYNILKVAQFSLHQQIEAYGKDLANL